MSLWWVKREQLDPDQVALVENLSLTGNHLILGPPGSGKTNVLLRRAQFVRTQGMPNVLVLTFTRSLTEFVKTGCYDQGRQIFPPKQVSTIESWIRYLYRQHGEPLPPDRQDLTDWKRDLASGAMAFATRGKVPRYDTLFIDEAQDLLAEEAQLISQWSPTLFFTGDDRQRIYDESDNLLEVRKLVGNQGIKNLKFHYRLSKEVCRAADKIMTPLSGASLESTSYYDGPTGDGMFLHKPASHATQIEAAAARLKDQLRVYADFIKRGDLLGVVVFRRQDREEVFNHFESDPDLRGKSKIIRARDEGESDYDPSFDPDCPICILTVYSCKGLEFRCVHWLFADEYSQHLDVEHYYTVVTRAKTRIDVYCTKDMPQELSRADAQPPRMVW